MLIEGLQFFGRENNVLPERVISPKSGIIIPEITFPGAAAYFIYEELKKIVRLKGYEYCIYKQAVTH